MEKGMILTPAPRKIVYREGRLKMPKGLSQALENTITSAKKLPGVAYENEPGLLEHNAEGYRLIIDNMGITIAAMAGAGRFYAAMTLRQIVRQCGSRGLPCLEIEDWPDFKARGLMLDISRDKVPTMETLFGLVNLMAEFKLNQFQLYTEHTFAYKHHKTVWKNASPMTAAEIRRLDAFCRERHIELVPNQNSFGHMERWLKHPDYKDLAEAPDGWTDWWDNRRNFAFSLNPGDPAALHLIQSLYDELLPNFKSRLFNVGCDETFDLGQGKSKERCEKLGVGRVYFEFLMKIHEQIKARGHVMQFWGDIIMRHPELIPEIPKDVIALNWGYEADHPFNKECKAFADAGVPFYVCPGTSSWNTVGGRWENARTNLLNAAENGLANGAIGYLNTDWGDNGHMQQLPVSYPGIVFGAAVSWALDANRKMDVPDALSRHVFRDATGKAAKALVLLGNAYLEAHVPVGNNSILSHILLEPEYLKVAKKATLLIESLIPKRLDAAAGKILLARKALAGSAPRVKEAALLKEELRLTADLLLFACRLGKARVTAKGRQVAGIPDIKKKVLAKELRLLIAAYRKLWLKRNRKGGLSDSVERLENLGRMYFGNNG